MAGKNKRSGSARAQGRVAPRGAEGTASGRAGVKNQPKGVRGAFGFQDPAKAEAGAAADRGRQSAAAARSEGNAKRLRNASEAAKKAWATRRARGRGKA